MTDLHTYVALVTLLALLVFFWTGIRVGGARSKYKIEAPATTGDPIFERHFRVQMNTLEGIVLFLPSLWLFSVYWGDMLAAAIGAVWIVGRVIYILSYVANPSSRSAGFAVQGLSSLSLLIGALYGVGSTIVSSPGL